MPKKIVVKIRNVEALDAMPESRPEMDEVIYHWDRIIGALFLAVGLVVAVYYLSVSLVGEDQPGADSTREPVVLAEPQERSPEGNLSASIALNDAEPDQLEFTQGLKTDQAEPETSPVSTEQVDVASPGSEEQVTATAYLKAVEPIEIPEAVEPETLPAPAAGQHIIGEDAAVVSPEIEVNTPSFTRVLLTSGVQHREPVDQLSGTLHMGDQNLLKVHLFTELNGQAGKVFYHQWYMNGKRAAKVRIPISTQHARVSSSKFIDRNMKGLWRVDVLGETGALLARARFTVM